MAVRFKKSIRNINFLDPTKGFEENRVKFEFRTDPLTLKRTRIMDLKFRLPAPPDLGELIDLSTKRPCPFCGDNLEKMTPKFPPKFMPEGRLQVGEAMVFPNFMPYDQNNAVAIFSEKHFIGLSQFSEDLLVDGFFASQAFLEKVYKTNLKHKYFSINWNYMPPSGASLIHPHLHLMADKIPSDHHKLVLKRAKRFWKKFKVNYWADLIAEEEKLQERFLGKTGSVCWLLSFAPRGMMFDVMGIFVEKPSLLGISRQELSHFAQGLQKIFAYLEKTNLISFNLTIFSGLSEKNYFWTYVHIVPRFTIPPLGTSDIGFPGLLHDEALCIVRPEEACREMKAYF